MNDRYLYRAKRIDNGEWVEGYYANCLFPSSDVRTGHFIIEYPGEYHEIFTSTICQCTGLKDKNGKLIWENDIVKCVDVNAETEFFAVVEFGNPNGFYSWGYQLKHIYGDEPNLDILLWIDMEESGAFCEVIGNIFDEGSENIVNEQKKIDFTNDCNAIVDYEELENAILWYSEKPTISKKHIYMHGKYPAVSIGREKIHIHRLLMMYWLKSKIPSEFSVHHINGNRLDARKENLSVILNSAHASKHNKGKAVTDKMRKRIIDFNHTRKGARQPHHRKDISYSDVKKLLDKGYSLNKIANELGCDWGTVKARVDDIFDNPELMHE